MPTPEAQSVNPMPCNQSKHLLWCSLPKSWFTSTPVPPATMRCGHHWSVPHPLQRHAPAAAEPPWHARSAIWVGGHMRWPYVTMPLDVAGCRWASLGFVGRSWTSLNIIGHRWVPFGIVGRCWASLGVIGHCWVSLGVIGHCWVSLGIGGCR